MAPGIFQIDADVRVACDDPGKLALEVCSPLGAGGIGEVDRAYDARLDREVAIKVLPQSLTSDPDRLRRFSGCHDCGRSG